MIRLDIDEDRFFHIEFRHLRRLPPRLAARAITTCVVVARDQNSPLRFVAIGNAVCDLRDNFSRRRGRLKALAHALDDCGALLEIKARLWQAYLLADPDPPPPTPPPKLSIEAKRERWEAGWEIRQKRDARRSLRSAIAAEGQEGK